MQAKVMGMAPRIMEKVELSGYLYQAHDGRWILSDDGHLKSCCVASPHKIAMQVVVDKQFPLETQNQYVRLKGVMLQDAQQVRTLKEVEIMTWQIPWATIIIAVLAFFVIKLYLRNRKA